MGSSLPGQQPLANLNSPLPPAEGRGGGTDVLDSAAQVHVKSARGRVLRAGWRRKSGAVEPQVFEPRPSTRLHSILIWFSEAVRDSVGEVSCLPFSLFSLLFVLSEQ